MLELCLCIIVNGSPVMFDRMQAHWLQSFPDGTTEIHGVRLTCDLDYIVMTGDLNFDGRVNMEDFACVSRNWTISPLQKVADTILCDIMEK